MRQNPKYTRPWIDVCPTDANLLASGGGNGSVFIYDRREFRTVKRFDKTHKRKICLNTNDQESNRLALSSQEREHKQ